MGMDTCAACSGNGMVATSSGEYERCGICRGQGFVRTAAVPVEIVEEAAVPSLEKLKVAELRVVAEQQGLDPTGKRDELIARIREATATPTEEAGTPPEAEPSAA
jgi:hypothetical protein